MVALFRLRVLLAIILCGVGGLCHAGVRVGDDKPPLPEIPGLPPCLPSVLLPGPASGDKQTSIMALLDLSVRPVKTGPLDVPESRQGSGTAWLPDSTPLFLEAGTLGKWQLGLRGLVSTGDDIMDGPRGRKAVILPNWACLSAWGHLGEADQLRLTLMMSLDHYTFGSNDVPQLFQTGNTINGASLPDQQGASSVFQEISARYAHQTSARGALFCYLAPVGEPALGPVAYTQRTYGLDDPLQPLGSPWQDATHVSFGVITAGYQENQWQWEASTFNGREPSDAWYNIQSAHPDSFSSRLSVNPSANWALQASYGYLRSPYALEPDVDIHRLTASAIYNYPLTRQRNFQATAVWADNDRQGQALQSFLLEGELKHDGGWSPYLRYEYLQQCAEDLLLPAPFSPEQRFGMSQLTLGVSRDIISDGSYQWGAGVQYMVSMAPDALQSLYGHNPGGWLFYIRVYPKQLKE